MRRYHFPIEYIRLAIIIIPHRHDPTIGFQSNRKVTTSSYLYDISPGTNYDRYAGF